MKFSRELRLAAIKEVRDLAKRRQELWKAEREKELELADIRREISEISEMVKSSCSAFGFELRGRRDEDGNLIRNEDGNGYQKDYFLEEEDAPE